MRLVALLVLLAQTPGTVSGQWVGPLELTVYSPQKARGAVPTIVDMQQDGDRITGTWRSLPPNTQSGSISGTLSKPVVVFYADAETEPERCQATVRFTARVTAANIYRLTAEKMDPETRAQKRCTPWPTDLVWTLQRAH